MRKVSSACFDTLKANWASIPQNHRATIESILFHFCEKKNIKHSAKQTFKSFCSVIWQKNFSSFFQCFAFFIHYAWDRIELKLYFFGRGNADVRAFRVWVSFSFRFIVTYIFYIKLFGLVQCTIAVKLYWYRGQHWSYSFNDKSDAIFCPFMKLFKRDRYHAVQALENLPLIKVCFSTGSQMIDTE